MVIIEGYIRDSAGQQQPLVGLPVEAFQQNLLGDLSLIAFPQFTNDEGFFKIIPQININETSSNVYIVVTDESKRFVSVRDRHSRYKRKEFLTVGGTYGWKWRGQIITNLNNIIQIVVKQDRISIPAEYDSVVIGSGFGGTIVSVAIAKMYKGKNENKRVCILERGQWWISHEIPDSNAFRTFLVKNNMPFSTWAYPNDIKGMLAAIGHSRAINKVQGLFDLKQLKNVNVIVGSGVGGGSLVYFNLTQKPERVVYENWPSERDGGPSLDEFYPLAEEFIGVNPITSKSAFGGPPLPKTKVFQDAAKQIGGSKILNPTDLSAKLSITDIPASIFDHSDGRPNQGDIKKFSSIMEANICQRQGRCGLGCIPDARHSLDKQIFTHINLLKLSIDIHSLCEALEIEELPPGQGYKYAVKFLDFQDLIDADDFSPSKVLTEDDKAKITKVIKTNRV